MLSGSYGPRVDPYAGRFQVFWGQADGRFKKVAVLNGTDDQPLVIRLNGVYVMRNALNTRPTAVDWDQDGKLDLIVGNSPGQFYFFKGEGEGKFLPESHRINDNRGNPLDVRGGHGDPFVIDWDGDGDLDLISGSGVGHVMLSENIAKQGEKTPSLKPFEILIQAGGRPSSSKVLHEKDIVRPASSTRVWVDDINSDGKLDVLVGDTVSSQTPAEGRSDAECEAYLEECMKEIHSQYAIMRNKKSKPEEVKDAEQKRRAAYARLNAAVTRKKQGFVWLYLQK